MEQNAEGAVVGTAAGGAMGAVIGASGNTALGAIIGAAVGVEQALLLATRWINRLKKSKKVFLMQKLNG